MKHEPVANQSETEDRRGRVLRVHSVPTFAEQIRTAVEIVAIVAAGLWALYTFVYEQRIKPLSEAPSFSLPTIVDQGSTLNGVVFLTIHKRLQNMGNVPIDIAAEALSVYGEAIERRRRYDRIETSTNDKVTADVPRRPVALLFSFAKLRSGALGGNQHTDFFVPAHSSAEETFLVAAPIKAYPVILIVRKDYVEKAPITPKLAIELVKTRSGAYSLHSNPSDLQGEYDTEQEISDSVTVNVGFVVLSERHSAESFALFAYAGLVTKLRYPEPITTYAPRPAHRFSIRHVP